MNNRSTHTGRYSCAVDSFLELAFAIFRNLLQHIELNEFFQTSFQASLGLENCYVETDMTLIREPVWAYLREHCNSFATMSADTIFSDIITLNSVGIMTHQLEFLFLIQRNHSVCSLCNNDIIKKYKYICSLHCSPEFGTQPFLKIMFLRLISGDVSVLQHFVMRLRCY